MGAGSFRVNFKVPELNDALNKISAYDGKARLKIEQAVSESTKAISRGAKKRVPVRTGRLKGTIGSRFDKNSVTGTVSAGKYNGSGFIAALRGGGAPYAHLVEFGHGGPAPAPAKPFMRPALEDEKPNLIRGLAEAVKP